MEHFIDWLKIAGQCVVKEWKKLFVGSKKANSRAITERER